MGRRTLAYRIGPQDGANYWLFEIEGSGSEIAELERRDARLGRRLRYLTVRVDEERQRRREAQRAARAQGVEAAGARGSRRDGGRRGVRARAGRGRGGGA